MSSSVSLKPGYTLTAPVLVPIYSNVNCLFRLFPISTNFYSNKAEVQMNSFSSVSRLLVFVVRGKNIVLVLDNRAPSERHPSGFGKLS